MTLKEGVNQRTYIVEEIVLPIGLERRLEALGLTQGAGVLVLNNDKKGSMTVKFRGTRFAIGRKIAENITVREGKTNE